jgi:uncharacterized membrane protein SirB2
MRARWIIAGVVAAIGLVWIGQGLGLVRTSSFMDRDGRWAAAGLALVVVGILIGWTAFRNRRSI